jgi:hypothetical protein
MNRFLIGFILFCLAGLHTYLVIQQDFTVPPGIAAEHLRLNGYVVIDSTGWSPVGYRGFSDRLSSGYIVESGGLQRRVSVVQDSHGGLSVRIQPAVFQ